MDRLRFRIPLLTWALALILCTCAPWGVRAEFEASDSANLAAIQAAVGTYLQGISGNVQAMRITGDQNLPYLSTIKSEVQTLRMAVGTAFPMMISEAQEQTGHLSEIASDADDAAYYLYGIDQTLDSMSDLLVNQPYNLQQIVDSSTEATTSLGEIDDGVDAVDQSVKSLTSGLSGEGQYAEDWGELEAFEPEDIDVGVTPYDDGQTILDRASTQFKNSFKSFLQSIYGGLDLYSFEWPIEQFQQTLKGYLVSAPSGVALTPSMSVLGFTVPPLVLDWAELKSSSLLLVFRGFVQALLVGMFGLHMFYRFASVT